MKYIAFLLMISFFWGCSNTVASDEDGESSSSTGKSSAILSSSSKGKSSSSSHDILSSSSSGSSSSSIISSSSGTFSSSSAITGTAWDGTTAKAFAGGAGTKLSPYLIATAEQLARFSFLVGSNDSDYVSKYYELSADILLHDKTLINTSGALVTDSTALIKWTPIGNSKVAFAGHFDGQDHTISGLFINTTSTHNGLFGNNAGTIAHVTLVNSWIQGGKYTAGIVGYNSGTVSNATNEAAVTGVGDCTGGIVGSSEGGNNSILTNVTNRGV